MFLKDRQDRDLLCLWENMTTITCQQKGNGSFVTFTSDQRSEQKKKKSVSISYNRMYLIPGVGPFRAKSMEALMKV